MNVTEYLEHIFALRVAQSELPLVQPIFQKYIWERMKPGVPSSDSRCRNALFHLLCSQTSCYRYCYWGEGLWTDQGRELCRRTIEILRSDFPSTPNA